MSHELIDRLTSGLSIYTVSKGCVKARIFFSHRGLKTTAIFHEYGSSPAAQNVSGCGYDVQGEALKNIFSDYGQQYGEVAAALQTVQGDGEWQRLLTTAGYIVQRIC